MRFLPILMAFSALPALAQVPAHNADTYREILAHGVVLVTPDMEIDVQFNPDGTFTAFKGLSSGKWHIDGEQMCSTPNETLIESCGVYPAGKKSGDTFEIVAPTGRVTVRIP